MQTFNEYQQFTHSLARYNTQVELYSNTLDDEDVPHSYHLKYIYPVLACAEEAGEVAGKLAKFIRKSLSEPVDVELFRVDMKKELGDLQFQVSEAARQLGYTLQEIVDGNVEKLTDRAERGVLIGEGDNR